MAAPARLGIVRGRRQVRCEGVPARSSLTGIAAVVVLLTLSLPATGATAGSSQKASEATGQRAGAEEQPEAQKAGQKRRRRCGGKQQQRVRRDAGERRRPRMGRGKRARRCRRSRQSPRRHRAPAPAPVAPILPAVPPPASGPPVATPAPVPAAPPQVGCAGADAVPTASNLPAVRSATLCLVNSERAHFGLAPLIDNAPLAVAAQGHADDMATNGYFSHLSADGRTVDQRIRAAGYLGGNLAENIAWGDRSLGTPRSIVGAWMNSAGHRASILNGLLHDSGIGVAPRTPHGGTGGTYVHDFGAP
jgi:uncharacterized protein YkwD